MGWQRWVEHGGPPIRCAKKPESAETTATRRRHREISTGIDDLRTMDSKIVELQTIADRDFQLDDKALRKAEAGARVMVTSAVLWICHVFVTCFRLGNGVSKECLRKAVIQLEASYCVHLLIIFDDQGEGNRRLLCQALAAKLQGYHATLLFGHIYILYSHYIAIIYCSFDFLVP